MKKDKDKTEAEVNTDFEDLATRTSRSTIAVIDSLMGRGAFKGEEALAIGQLREQCIQVIQTIESKHNS